MKNKTLIYLLFFVIILGSGIQASAFMYDLNQSISGGPPISTVPSYGTLSITDDTIAGKVDILISLNVSTEKILEFSLNYTGAAFGPSTAFSLTSGDTVVAKANGISADGYHGKLDLGSQETGNIGDLGTFSAVLSANDRLLSASDLNTLDTLGLIYGAVHMANLNANGDSIWLGAGPSNSNPVPEPGTILLLATGLFGMVVYRKRTAA
jgi:hypothetical protein